LGTDGRSFAQAAMDKPPAPRFPAPARIGMPPMRIPA
jgi:hypothetical protein